MLFDLFWTLSTSLIIFFERISPGMGSCIAYFNIINIYSMCHYNILHLSVSIKITGNLGFRGSCSPCPLGGINALLHLWWPELYTIFWAQQNEKYSMVLLCNPKITVTTSNFIYHDWEGQRGETRSLLFLADSTILQFPFWGFALNKAAWPIHLAMIWGMILFLLYSPTPALLGPACWAQKLMPISEILAVSSRSVSYTHLTLPTKA